MHRRLASTASERMILAAGRVADPEAQARRESEAQVFSAACTSLLPTTSLQEAFRDEWATRWPALVAALDD